MWTRVFFLLIGKIYLITLQSQIATVIDQRTLISLLRTEEDVSELYPRVASTQESSDHVCKTGKEGM